MENKKCSGLKGNSLKSCMRRNRNPSSSLTTQQRSRLNYLYKKSTMKDAIVNFKEGEYDEFMTLMDKSLGKNQDTRIGGLPQRGFSKYSQHDRANAISEQRLTERYQEDE